MKGSKKHQRHACQPPAGKTYLTIGQDLFSMEGYLRDQYNYSLHDFHPSKKKKRHSILSPHPFLPVAAMFYTDLQELRGLKEPVDYGSGIEFASGILNNAPDIPALQIGLWLNGTTGCRDLVQSNSNILDENLHTLFRYLETCSAKRIFLRVGYEFDNPDFEYYDDNDDVTTTGENADPGASYRAAFVKIVDTCRARGKHCYDKIDFVWHSWGAGIATAKNNSSMQENMSCLEQFYPGDRYVDWVGVSLFTQLYANSSSGSLDTLLPVLAFARLHGNKPVMIAESTPFGGINNLLDPWNDWFQPVLDLIEEHDNIAMWSYINCDWETQPMWQYAGFGDTRLSTNKTVMKMWQKHVLNNPRFLMADQVDSLAHCRRNDNEGFQREMLGTPSVLDGLNTDIILGENNVQDQVQEVKLPLFCWFIVLIIAVIVAMLIRICFRWYERTSRYNRIHVSIPENGSEVREKDRLRADKTGYGSLV